MTTRRTHVRRTASCIHDEMRGSPPDSCRIFNPTANAACISKQSRHVPPFFFPSLSFLFFPPFRRPRFLSSEDGEIPRVSLAAPVLMYRFPNIFISLLRRFMLACNSFPFFSFFYNRLLFRISRISCEGALIND